MNSKRLKVGDVVDVKVGKTELGKGIIVDMTVEINDSFCAYQVNLGDSDNIRLWFSRREIKLIEEP